MLAPILSLIPRPSMHEFRFNTLRVKRIAANSLRGSCVKQGKKGRWHWLRVPISIPGHAVGKGARLTRLVGITRGWNRSPIEVDGDGTGWAGTVYWRVRMIRCMAQFVHSLCPGAFSGAFFLRSVPRSYGMRMLSFPLLLVRRRHNYFGPENRLSHLHSNRVAYTNLLLHCLLLW